MFFTGSKSKSGITKKPKIRLQDTDPGPETWHLIVIVIPPFKNVNPLVSFQLYCSQSCLPKFGFAPCPSTKKCRFLDKRVREISHFLLHRRACFPSPSTHSFIHKYLQLSILSWPPLAAAANSRNLGPTFFTIPVVVGMLSKRRAFHCEVMGGQ